MAIFYWRGSTGGTASAYDYNNPKNWVELIKPTTNSSTWFNRTATRCPGAAGGTHSGSGDWAAIGLGATALSPLLYGGFSGSSVTGGYANGVGATFAAGNSGGNFLSFLEIYAIYSPISVSDAQNFYPFTVLGGGKNAIYDLGGFGGSGATDTPGLTLDATLDDPRYDSLKIKAAMIRDITTADTQSGGAKTQKLINLNLVKCVDTKNNPFGVYQKGRKYSTYGGGTAGGMSGQFIEWAGFIPGNGMPTSKSSVILSGFLNEFQDVSRPSLEWIASGEKRYGSPSVTLLGCTLGSYNGTNLCPLEVGLNSTVGNIKMVTPYVYQYGLNTPSDYASLKIQGEVNAGKVFSALGYPSSLTGGVTGAGVGEVILEAVNQTSSPLPSGSPTLVLGTNIIDSGVTAPAKIGKVQIFGGWNLPSMTQVTIDSVNIGEMITDRTRIVGSPLLQPTSQANFGILDLRNNSELWLNSNPAFNNWSFGVTSGGTGATSTIGGIYGDDSSLIRLSSGVALFNTVLERVIPRYVPKTGRFSNIVATEITPDSLEAIE